MTWLRRVLTWRPTWREPGHWCGSCNIGRELAPYGYRHQPVREALPLEPHQRDDELALLEEGWR